MATVVGLDLSLSSTGCGRITYGTSAVAEAWRRPSAACWSIEDMHRRIVGICADVMAWSEPCDLAVVEGPSFASSFGKAHERGGLWWRVVGRLIDHEVPVAVVPPRSLKLWATGSGAASKQDMIRNAEALWPGVELGNNSDKADALLLASAGAQHLGLLPNLTQDPSTLSKVVWPDDLELAA